MNGMKSAALFLGGCLVGGAIAWFAAKKTYEERLEEEIDSVRAVYKRELDAVYQEVDNTSDKTKELETAIKIASNSIYGVTQARPDDQDAVDDILEEEGYVPREEVTRSANKPYIISPDEFSETPDGYHTISLYYYADEVLADERDEVVEDVEDVVGFDSLNHFGEYEDDAVYVRNEGRRCDYEILLCLSNYRDKFKDRVRWVKPD